MEKSTIQWEGKSRAPEKTRIWDPEKTHTEITIEALGADTLESERESEDQGLENRFCGIA